MRKKGRKNKLAYSFLEIFLSLSIFSVLLSIAFAFPVKILSGINSVQQQQDNFIDLYEKISPYIQRTLNITLRDRMLVLKLCAGSKEKTLSVAFVDKKCERRRNVVVCCLPVGVYMEWYCWREDSEWGKLIPNKTYTNLRFLKVVFTNAKGKILEQFVFSCYAMSGNLEGE